MMPYKSPPLPERLLVSLFKPDGSRTFSYFVHSKHIKRSHGYLFISTLFMSLAVIFFTTYYKPIVGDFGRIPYEYDPLTPVFFTALFAIFSMIFRAFMNKQFFDVFIKNRSPFNTHEKTFTAREGLPKFSDAEQYKDAMLAKQNTMAFRYSEFAILSLNGLYLLAACFYGHLEIFDIVVLCAFTLASAWLTSATEFRYNIPSNKEILQSEMPGGKWVIEDKEGRRVVTNLP
jgi:hypothetical protein